MHPVADDQRKELSVENLRLINVEFYTGIDNRLDLPVMLSPVAAANRDA